MNPFEYHFGYAWQYSYVHLIPLAVGLIALLFSIRFKRSRWLVASFAIISLVSLRSNSNDPSDTVRPTLE